MNQHAITPSADLNSPMTLLPTQFNGEFSTEEQLSLISRIAAASIGSQGTVGGLVIAGVVSLFPFEFYSRLYNFFHPSSLKQLDGACWSPLVVFTSLFTLMNAYHGQTKPKKENSRISMSNMRRES
jgi:hypothetical protein